MEKRIKRARIIRNISVFVVVWMILGMISQIDGFVR